MIDFLAYTGFAALVCAGLTQATAPDGKKYGIKRMGLIWVAIAFFALLLNLGSIFYESGADKATVEKVTFITRTSLRYGVPIVFLIFLFKRRKPSEAAAVSSTAETRDRP